MTRSLELEKSTADILATKEQSCDLNALMVELLPSISSSGAKVIRMPRAWIRPPRLPATYTFQPASQEVPCTTKAGLPLYISQANSGIFEKLCSSLNRKSEKAENKYIIKAKKVTLQECAEGKIEKPPFVGTMQYATFEDYRAGAIDTHERIVKALGIRARRGDDITHCIALMLTYFWMICAEGIKKRPYIFAYGGDVLRPRSMPKGPSSSVANINDYGTLSSMVKLPGINESMFYISQTFTRFPWHIEDAALPSISYLHEESTGYKVWWVVLPEDAEKFENVVRKEIISESFTLDRDLDESVVPTEFIISARRLFFSPEVLCSHGVRVKQFIQKPGTIIVTAPRAYHAGVNIGYSIAEAANFGNAFWFSAGALCAERAAKARFPAIVPFEYLLMKEAETMLKYDKDGRKGWKLSERVKEVDAIVAPLMKLFSNHIGLLRVLGSRGRGVSRKLLHDKGELKSHGYIRKKLHESQGLLCIKCGALCALHIVVCDTCRSKESVLCLNDFAIDEKCTFCNGRDQFVVQRYTNRNIRRNMKPFLQASSIYSDEKSVQDALSMLEEAPSTSGKSKGHRRQINEVACGREMAIHGDGPPSGTLESDSRHIKKRKKRMAKGYSEQGGASNQFANDADIQT